MFGSNDSIVIFVLATESMGEIRWQTNSKSALKNYHACKELIYL